LPVEGGDELFAGYSYLKDISLVDLPFELLDITARLHNTALQRVDRCAGAFGLTAHIPFLDPGLSAMLYKSQRDIKYMMGS